MTEHRRNIKDFLYVFFSSSFGQALRIVRNLFVAGMIGPQLYGVIQGLNIFLLYVPVIQFGYFQAANRAIPQLIGRGDSEKVSSIEVNGIMVVIASSIVAMVLYGAMFAWVYPDLSTSARICWAGFSITLLLQPLGQFYQVLFTAHGDFQSFSRIKMVESIVFFLLIVLVMAFGYIGQLISLALSAMVLSVMMVRKKPVPLRGRTVDRGLIRAMVRQGFPILLSAMAFNIFYTIDKVFIIGVKGAQEFGYYSIGASVFQIAIFIPESIRLISYRFFNVEYGKGEGTGRLRQGFWLSFIVVSMAMWVLAVASYTVLPYLIAVFLPGYLPAIEVLRVFSVTMGVAAPGMLLSSALYSVHRERAVLWVYLGSMLIFVVGILAFMNYHLPTVTVALLISASYGTSSVAMFVMVAQQQEYRLPAFIFRRLSAVLLLLIAASVGMMALVQHLLDGHAMLLASLSSVLYLAGITGAALWVRRHRAAVLGGVE